MELSQQIVDTSLYEGRSYMSKSGRKRWSQHVLWDDALPGFGLRITPTNRKSFIVSYRAKKRKRTKTLGAAGRLKLDEARQKAREFLESVGGETSARAAAEPQLKGVETVAQLADAYLENQLKGKVPSWYADQRLMRTHIKPALGRARAADVTRSELANLASRVGRRFPSDAKRLKALLRGMFDWAAEQGLRPAARRERFRDEPPASAEPAAEPPPKPASLPPAAELFESLGKSEERCRELEAQLEEVSAGGAEMLATVHQQRAEIDRLRVELQRSRRQRHATDGGEDDSPRADKIARETANLRQSVEQLMDSVAEARGESQRLADELAAVKNRAADQARQLAAATRSRNELEERLREKERRAAMRKAQSRATPGRRPPAIWLAAGLIAGVLLTLLAVRPGGRQTAVEAAVDPAAGDGGAAGSSAAVATAAEAAPSTRPAATPVVPPASPAAEPSPAAAGTAEPATAGPDLAAAESAVRAWASAWAAQDVDAYLAAYARSFVPADGSKRAAWAAERRLRLRRPAWIRLEIDQITAAAAGPGRARLSFRQSYRTPTYSDQVDKTLELVREDGGWKIVAERAG